MNLDTRAHRAAQGIHRAVEVSEMTTPTRQQHQPVERFDRFRSNKQRNQRIGAGVVAFAVIAAALVLVVKAMGDRDQSVPGVTPISASNVATLHEIALAPTRGEAFRMASGNGVLVVSTGANAGGPGGQLIGYPFPCGGGTDPACNPLWTGTVDDTPVVTVADDVVYARGLGGATLYAYSVDCRMDGGVCDPLWSADLGGRSSSGQSQPPVVADGQVFVSNGPWLRAFDTSCANGSPSGATCLPAWSAHLTDGVRALAFKDSILYVGTGPLGQPVQGEIGSIRAFNATCSKAQGCPLLWNQTVPQVWSISVDGDTVYVGTNGLSDGIQAYPTSCAQQAGQCRPTWIAGTSCCTEVTTSDGVVYAHDHVSNTYGFAEGCASGGQTCQPTWQSSDLPFDPFVDFTAPHRAGDVVFVGGDAGTAYAYDANCAGVCHPSWQAEVDPKGIWDAMPLGDRLYVAAHDGLHVYATDPTAPVGGSNGHEGAPWAAAALIAAIGVGIVMTVRGRRSA